MASCHPSDNIEPPVEPPVEPDVEEPVEEGTPLLFEPNEAVTITVANETFTVDFSISEEHLRWVFHPPFAIGYLKKTREDYIDGYKRLNGFFMNAYDMAKFAIAEFVQMEYTLAQECFNVRCTSEMRKEVLQTVVDKQKRKYTPNAAGDPVNYSYAIHSGVLLMAVIMVKEREYSAQFIDHETLQKALLFLNDFDYFTDESLMYYGRDFSDLIVDRARNFLMEFN